ncbi:MAG: hypothetical protein IPJ79_08170 [Bacteroidetes bacterium]|jgi:hypothetical protein|nr:hypothetical protein [Bacteroidota bacterium]HNR20436.1 hypothetical protein [Bacteroidia bacterium]HNU32910.1 hypothetical protein [Bacteroidia bacterium]
MSDNRKEDIKKASSLIIGGCLFIGMATGWYCNKLIIGMFAGLGLGLLLYGVITLNEANKSKQG